MNHSNYQEAIFDHFEKQAGHSAVISVAGSGKTYTALEAIGRINNFNAVLLAAFNVITRDEFRKKGEERGYKHVTYNNYNGFGWGICLRNMKVQPELDEDKTAHVLEFVTAKFLTEEQFRTFVGPIVQLVSLFKATNLHTVDAAQLAYDELVDHHDIDTPDDKDFKSVLFKTWHECMVDQVHFDFDDQKWMPLHLEMPIPCFDQVVVDEFQDTCPLEMELLLKAAAGGQFAGFGDPDQCIYSFKGANPESFDRFVKLMDAKQLPLSICYRCPEAVIAEAQKIVPRIEAAPGAIAGHVSNVKDLKSAQPGDMVLCRTTEDLVAECIKCMRRGVPSKVRGRDFGKNVIWLARKITKGNNMPIEDFVTAMMDHKIQKSEQLIKLRRDKEVTRLQDQCATLKALCEDCSYSDHIEPRMKEIFTDNQHGGIDFLTIHKAKGLQRKNVFVLRPDLLPHPRAKQPWMLAEEKRLKYVAITRAEENLFWVQKEK